jgi:uncharacterized membrane protein
MDWTPLVAAHVIAALYVLVLGPLNIFRRRRDHAHRIIGYTWVAGMYFVCFSSFWIVTDGHFSWLHGLSAFTIITVTLGLVSAIRRNIVAHRANMIGSYIGTVTAFVFAAAVPGRAIPQLLADDPGTAVVVAVLVLLTAAGLYLAVRPAPRNIPAGSIRTSKTPV